MVSYDLAFLVVHMPICSKTPFCTLASSAGEKSARAREFHAFWGGGMSMSQVDMNKPMTIYLLNIRYVALSL